MKFYKLDNTIQNYLWGSHSFLQDLLDLDSTEPMAELWIGAHPKAPSKVSELKLNLDLLIKKLPIEILGKKTFDRFGKLPFLMKVLCAEKALSIQTHPSLNNAQKGFTLENEKEIPLTASFRNYKDDNHKPELICALTKFTAMCGFRSFSKIIDLLGFLSLNFPFMKEFVKEPTNENLRKMFLTLLELSIEQREDLSNELLSKVSEVTPRNNEDELIIKWVKELSKQYPRDPGIISPILLNVIELNPGEAISLKAGVLHAYLEGNGIEIMANSDNVLRGGLTSKHIDISELAKNVNFEEMNLVTSKTFIDKNSLKCYDTPFLEFQLATYDLKNEKINYSKMDF